MRSNYLRPTLKPAALAVTILLLMAGLLSAQTVNLTASQQTTILPDGNTVPMWGWTCGAAVTGSTATCSALTYNTATGAHNLQTGGTTWQPPLIVVPYMATGTSLTISLTNNLPVETSIVIIGQAASSASTTANGGLGTPVREAGPRTDGAHAGQTATTWTTVNPGSFMPQTQGERVRSFVPEVAGVATVGATPAVGTYTWTNLKPGTYLMRSATYPSIQGPMGLYGVLVVTQAPGTVTGSAAGLAYPVSGANTAVGGVTYDFDVVALESEIDPSQNKMVATLFPIGGAAGSATANPGFSETAKWTPACGAGKNGLTSTGSPPTCYPPAVDYTPLYFLVNGLAFSKDNQAASALSIPATGSTGNVLVRYVNAGSHMHVPTVVGLNMLLVAEDGYVLPDVALALSHGKTLSAKQSATPSGLQVRNEVFQSAGKVFDVIVSPTQTTAGTYDTKTYPTFDRSLALSTNSQRDGGMQAILDVNDAGATQLAAANSSAAVVADEYSYAPGVTLTVSDPGKGVIANDTNVYGVQISTLPTSGTVTLYPNGTFTYVPTGTGADSFGYCANGTTTSSIPSYCATVTLNVSATANAANAPVANPDSYTSKVATLLRVGAPGVLQNDVDPNGYPLTAVNVAPGAGLTTLQLNPDGSFTATPATSTSCSSGCTFTYQAKNSQNILSTAATVTLTFLPASNLTVHVYDAPSVLAGTPIEITDYKWIIEQDLTLHIDPACQQNGSGGTKPATCPTGLPVTPATNFHASYSPVIAEGCTGPQSCEKGQTVYDAGTPCTNGQANNPAGCSLTAGQHVLAACDGYGICTIGASSLPMSKPADANLTATNPDGSRAAYYISILSGDAQNAFAYANTKDPSVPGNCTPGQNGNPTSEPTGITESSACGHTMGGAPIPAAIGGLFAPVTVNLQPAPLKTATVTAYIFEDDFPLNGEPDAGGGIDILATNEPPLGDFQIEIWDTAGGIGDFTGQMTYDMFNMPLTNALNGTIDPVTGFDACPIANTKGVAAGVVIVCPRYESDGKTLSPLTGQVVVKNLMQGKFSLIAHPGAAREAAGEEWLQTNSLDGGHFLDSFLRVGEPPYFQEFGPAGFHVFVGFANPKIINARLAALCAAGGSSGPTACRNHINAQVTNLHQGRSPSEQLYSGAVFGQGNPSNYAPLNYTNCYAALGDSDGATIALAKCDPDGNFTFPGVPDGNYGLVLFDQWDDLIVDGSSHAVNVSGGQTVNLTFPSFTWQAHLWNRAYIDVGLKGAPVLQKDGTLDPALSPGLIQIPVRIRQRNGKFVNTLFTDAGGTARFDETFPLFAFYTVESDTTRFRGTGVHVVNDAGGQVDGPRPVGNGNTGPYQGILNSREAFPLPPALSVPGAVYCPAGDAACAGTNLGTNPNGSPSGPGVSTGRIDPGHISVEGWQGGVSEFDMIDWGKTPYIPGENGGIRGHVVNATTRPFDDTRMLFQNLWEPLVPNVTVNLYQEGTATDGTTSLTLVDTTLTSSWDSWAQGFHTDPTTGATIPNMSCTGQDTADPFFSYTLAGTTNYLFPNTPLPNNSQYKCYDGYHNLNQLQPAPYDGLYQFPSQTCLTAHATFTVAGNPSTYTCATVPNPAAGQPGAAAAILPLGKYVTEVVVPPGWQLSKEEDLNLLIGDQYIAPVTQQFPAGLGSIFIVPDQAAIDSINPSYTGPYTTANPYNPPFAGGGFTPTTTNNGKPSTDLGRTSFGSFGPGGLIQQSAPCVGLMRIVPDYLSIAPESGEVAPFAGSTRALCDRKEITLDDQMQANADFFIYTHTPKAATFTGFISDDFSSEFDPAAPAFGEKFAVPNVPVSIKDFSGHEVSRIYSDQWGTFNGLVYSTWEVDPPNITGYSPNMMITCMNDPGPIPGQNGTMITDPYYNPSYSNFCYENPFMPADAAYLDTPVVPTAAFAEGYNPPDCAYPDSTPAIKSVTGATIGGGAGPYITNETDPFTITAAGDQLVPNDAYSGPAAITPPYNQKFILRHYGFGSGAQVTVGGVAAACTGSDLSLTCSLPATPFVPLCAKQQRGAGNGGARCGEIVITAANGQRSIDSVTLTVGGKPPTYIKGENGANNAIQSAIDQANPGDLIIVGPGTYNEMVIMWKPVRLQGVGANSVILNANAHPAGKLDPWRREIDCLFGLALNGQPYSTPGNLVPNPVPGQPPEPLNPYDPSGTFSCPGTGWVAFNASPNNPQVDRLPLEGLVGWDTTVNGNLAEMLQEPSLMGAYEGAAITVVAKGVRYPAGVEVFGAGPDTAAGSNIAHESQMPVGTNLLTGSAQDCDAGNGGTGYSSNFLCNPSRIDGLSIINSSQGGGGIFAHAWAHNLEISNNRITNNAGTLSGGIVIGQGESPDALLAGNGGDPLAPLGGFDQQPWTCVEGAVINGVQNPNPPGFPTGTQLPFCYNRNVNVHNNDISLNAAYGDELFSSTPAGAGGVTFGTGADNYDFTNNWVCGNLSTGDGGGIAHLGFSYNGEISHNSILFNQSNNPTITSHGGGIVVMSTSPDGSTATQPECGSLTDADCAPGLSDGAGPGLLINANLIQGNTAESGSGGGIRLQLVNGTEMTRFPKDADKWYRVRITNNIIANNVAGWTGGGVSLVDAVNVDFVNNTVASNDSTATAGVLFGTLGSPLASVPPPTAPITTSTPQPAGLATEHNTPLLSNAIASLGVVCPDGHPQCATFSNPTLRNSIFWQNRAFYITAPAGGAVQLNPALTQTTTGACPAANYWDIGVYNDTAPNNHASGLMLHPTYSILDDPADYPTGNNRAGSTTTFVRKYCNGSRVPPEIAPLLCTSTAGNPNGNFANAPGCIQPGTVGLQMTVPGGVPDSLVPPIPAFTLTPAATVDEGSNWINMFYGPLSLTNPTILSGTTGYGISLGNYAPASGSPAIDAIPVSVAHPALDFFGNPRPDPNNPNNFDVGAVEFQPAAGTPPGGTPPPPALILSVPTIAFANQVNGTTSTAMSVTLTNNGGSTATITYSDLTGTGFARVGGAGTCGAALGAGAVCSITITFAPSPAPATPTFNATLNLTFAAPATAAMLSVELSGTGVSPGIILGTGPFNFGTQTSTTPLTKSITLINNGTAPLNITAIAIRAGTTRFALTSPQPAGACTIGGMVAVNGTCSVSVTFQQTPTFTSTTPRNGTLTVRGNGGMGAPTVTGSLALTAN